MKRRAILIATTEKSNKVFTESVLADIDNFKTFLCSNYGGAWEDTHEVETLIDPDSEKLQKYLSSISYDCTLTYFTGHGFADINTGKEYISFINDDHLSDDTLINKSLKQLMIFDCCNSLIQSDIPQFRVPIPEYLSAAGHSDVREFFFKVLYNTDDNIVKLKSSQFAQPSGYNNRGGLFTQSLLNCSLDKNKFSDKFKTIHTCYNLTKSYMNTVGITHQPRLLGRKKSFNFPFMINIE